MKFLAILLMAFFFSEPAQGLSSRTVEYRHGDELLEGYLVYPDGFEGKRPGVLVVHEWWGLNDFARSRAEEMAKKGYVAFALDMYGKGVSTSDPAEAAKLSGRFKGSGLMAERARAGLEVLLQDEHVDKERVCAIGFCFGGATVLKLAYSGAEIQGAASFHGSMPVIEAGESKRLKAALLVLHGAADPFVPEEEIDRFRKALEKAKADWQMVLFGGAVHSFTNPEAGNSGLEGVAYDQAAAESAFAYLDVFLKRIFS